MPNQRSEAVANEFLRRAGGRGLTQLQLQKLVYIAHGWTLAYSGQPLTSTEPEAWDRGPVYPELRDKIIYVGSSQITGAIHENDSNPFAVFASEKRGAVISGNFDQLEHQIIDHVWGRYGHLHGFTLSDLTHGPDTPWHKAYYTRGRNSVIPNSETHQHYYNLAKELADQQATAN